MSRKNLIWIASYPKSGNTWLRLILNQLLQQQNKTQSSVVSHHSVFDNDHVDRISSSRKTFEDCLHMCSSDLFPDEIDSLRPKVFRVLSDSTSAPLYIKTHEAYTLTSAAEPIFPPETTKSAIYIVRNPLDVSISYSHHFSLSIDKSIECLNDENHRLAFGSDKLFLQLPQKLLSWSSHVRSWITLKTIPVLLIRFEDLKKDPAGVIEKVASFLGLNSTRTEITNAVRLTEFSHLKRSENKLGFSEKINAKTAFFRDGTSGQWQTVLSQAHIGRLVSKHEAVMSALNYLDNHGNPGC